MRRADAFAWAGARTLVQQCTRSYAELAVKRAEYEEKGPQVCRQRFKSIYHVAPAPPTSQVPTPGSPAVSST